MRDVIPFPRHAPTAPTAPVEDHHADWNIVQDLILRAADVHADVAVACPSDWPNVRLLRHA